MEETEKFKKHYGPILLNKISSEVYTPIHNLKSVQVEHLDTMYHTIAPCSKPISKIIDFEQFINLDDCRIF